MDTIDAQSFWDLVEEKNELDAYFANLGNEIDLFEYEVNRLSLNEINSQMCQYRMGLQAGAPR